NDQQRSLPVRARGERVVHGEHEVLTVLDVGRYMIVVRWKADRVEVAEVRVDPGDRWQCTPGSVLNEAGRLWVDAALDASLPAQARMAEECEPIMAAESVVAVGETQSARLEGVPAPGDVTGVQVPDERRAVVERWQVERKVIAAARSATANGVQTVGPG